MKTALLLMPILYFAKFIVKSHLNQFNSIFNKLRRLKFRQSRIISSFIYSNKSNFSQGRDSLRMISLNNPIEIGLTGSIGMGKSTIANYFEKLGFPVFDADKEVHRLYSNNSPAVIEIQKIVPEAVLNGNVNRKVLSRKIVENPSLLKEIERIVHPMVIRNRKIFFQEAQRNHQLMVIYDIPLLFENRGNYNVDYTIVVSASPELQKLRVLSRPEMNLEKFESILAKQVPDHEKQKMADFVISTDYSGFSEAKSQASKVIEKIIESHPQKWEIWKSFDQDTSLKDSLDSKSIHWSSMGITKS